MLQKLTVQNFALIDSASVSFSENLSVITGETGAGKSILLGALAFALGERADLQALRDKQQKCVIEAEFLLPTSFPKDFFLENDLDFDRLTLLRREITPAGRSRSFINDTPVNLQVLKQLGAELVNVHSQHETLELSQPDFQLNLLDAVAGQMELFAQYQNKWKRYREKRLQLSRLETGQRQTEQELDYHKFQLEELENLQLSNPDEQADLEKEAGLLENAQEIQQILQEIDHNLNERELAVSEELSALSRAAGRFGEADDFLSEIAKRLEALSIEAADIAREAGRAVSGYGSDPERLHQIQSRLNEIYRLEKKHGVNNLEGLIRIREEIRSKIELADQSQENLDSLRKEEAQARKEVIEIAEKLSAGRKKAIPEVEKKTIGLLAEVSMKDASLKIALQPAEAGPNGADSVQFLFSANRGGDLRELSKVASGGELSRLMLCLKSLLASRIALPTLIFDEIDTGISGETALRVGALLESLSQNHQVICISHLPQIAAKGNHHLLVKKIANDHSTQTRIELAKGEDRVRAIATMLHGENPGQAALANAKELLGIPVSA